MGCVVSKSAAPTEEMEAQDVPGDLPTQQQLQKNHSAPKTNGTTAAGTSNGSTNNNNNMVGNTGISKPIARSASATLKDAFIGGKRARRAGIKEKGSGQTAQVEIVSVPKSDEAKQHIEQAIKSHYLLGALGESEVHVLVDAMAPLKVPKGFEVMKQGDQGDFFYVIGSGEYDIYVGGVAVDVATPGQCVGELALMFGHPRTATVTAKSEGLLWRLGRKEFRAAMGKAGETTTGNLLNFLNKVQLFQDLREYQRMRIAEALRPVKFADGDIIQLAGEVGTQLYLITKGHVLLTADGTQLQSTQVFENDEDNRDSARRVEAKQAQLSVGDVFGERSLLLDEPLKHSACALGDVECYTMDRPSFDALMGPLRDLLAHVQDLRLLESIPILQKLTEKERSAVISAFEFRHYQDGEYIIRQGERGDAFYVVKSGSVVVTRNYAKSDADAESFVLRRVAGEYFGEMALIDDGPRAGNVVAEGEVTVARLERDQFEKLLGPLRLILERDTSSVRERIRQTSTSVTADGKKIHLEDVKMKRVLGCGAFGMVKLVTFNGQNYALKCLKRSEVIKMSQQEHVRSELEIMSMLTHPFVMKLVASFKDDRYVYMMLELIQGGELFHRISSLDTALPADHARFYAANVVEALQYIHDLDIVYRDLKPENILIDSLGYLKIVDFGCAKVVHGRTHTLCGSPEYVAPEVLLGKGYTQAVDLWSLGVLVYEMAVGFSPFNPSQNLGHLQVCSNIIQGTFLFPRAFTDSVLKDFIRGLLMVDPTKRLGRLAGGWNDIRKHPWFEGFDWEAMRNKKMPAPWVPPLKSGDDMSMFETVEEEQQDDDDPSQLADESPGWDAEF